MEMRDNDVVTTGHPVGQKERTKREGKGGIEGEREGGRGKALMNNKQILSAGGGARYRAEESSGTQQSDSPLVSGL